MLRRPERLEQFRENPRVTLLAGDLTKPADVVKATKGADLIWSAVVDHDQTNRPTKNIIAAAKLNRVERVVETSLLGLYNEVPGEFGNWNRVLADQLLAESSLTYTTLRLPWLNDRPEVNYTLTHRHDQFVGVSGSRRSIADPSLGANDSLGIGDSTTEGATRPVY
ncbi:NAD(P)-binding oxidoreductase [Limosilactobacillus fermentum]|uniref:NAD(P)-binding oxidoreductase n=1 Tax=Limosilactobacillus fermentum TaxID=1613 RepID=UPI003F0E82C5